jgi:hypothetical protein
MDTHLEFRLHGGFATTTRLVARLHALGVEVAELHASAGHMCVHLTDDRDARRVRTVLNRNADATVQPIESDREAPCGRLAQTGDVPATTYVVWSEPLDTSWARHRRGSRISA